ncbi:MAG: hypothetical protein JXA67_06205 [Micromonosporaceae bacterium]|nr:hypothetical protein [Micromonosporaceae bacterium]
MDAHDPMVNSIFQRMAEKLGKETSLGAMARGILAGELTLREATRSSWCNEEVMRAYTHARDEQSRIQEQEKAKMMDAAKVLYRKQTTARGNDHSEESCE